MPPGRLRSRPRPETSWPRDQGLFAGTSFGCMKALLPILMPMGLLAARLCRIAQRFVSLARKHHPVISPWQMPHWRSAAPTAGSSPSARFRFSRTFPEDEGHQISSQKPRVRRRRKERSAAGERRCAVSSPGNVSCRAEMHRDRLRGLDSRGTA